MKGFIFISLFFAMSSAFAAFDITVYGRASDQSHCLANNYFCASNLKSRTESQASSNAQWDCMSRRGQALTYTAFCNTSCSPGYIPPNTDTWVRCNSECRMTCTIQ